MKPLKPYHGPKPHFRRQQFFGVWLWECGSGPYRTIGITPEIAYERLINAAAYWDSQQSVRVEYFNPPWDYIKPTMYGRFK